MSAIETEDHDDERETVTVAQAKQILDQREKDKRSQYARDIVEAGRIHGLDIVTKVTADGETIFVGNKIPEKVPFGMLLTLVSLRAVASRHEGRVDAYRAILETCAEVDRGESIDDFIYDHNVDDFRAFADACLEELGEPRILTDAFV